MRLIRKMWGSVGRPALSLLLALSLVLGGPVLASPIGGEGRFVEEGFQTRFDPSVTQPAFPIPNQGPESPFLVPAQMTPQSMEASLFAREVTRCNRESTWPYDVVCTTTYESDGPSYSSGQCSPLGMGTLGALYVAILGWATDTALPLVFVGSFFGFGIGFLLC